MVPDGDEKLPDRQRLADLFHQHGNSIFAYACHRLPVEDARDVVAEVFTVAWRRLAEVRVGEERAWLFGVARRIIQAQHRRGIDHLALRERLRANAAVDRTDGGHGFVEGAEVAAVLAAMPERYREVLLLRYWYDLTATEAARVLGCTGPTFAVRLHRARRRFRAAYEAQDAADERGANDPRLVIRLGEQR